MKFTTQFSEKSTVHFRVWAPFQGYNIFIEDSNKFFFPRCTIKSSACKITQAKTKDDGIIGTSTGWKIWRYFEQRIRVTSPFLFQVNFSILLLEVCFLLLSVTSKIVPFQFVHFKPAHMQNHWETIWRVSFKQSQQCSKPTLHTLLAT